MNAQNEITVQKVTGERCSTSAEVWDTRVVNLGQFVIGLFKEMLVSR